MRALSGLNVSSEVESELNNLQPINLIVFTKDK